MKIISPSVEKLPCPKGYAEVMKHLETCGRVCYKSEDRITEESCYPFIRGIIKRGHEAVLEHAGIIIVVGDDNWGKEWIDELHYKAERFGEILFVNITQRVTGEYVLSGNIRAWRSFFRFCIKERLSVFRAMVGIFKCYGYLFDDIMPDVRTMDGKQPTIYEVHANELCGDMERAVHERHTVRIICDRGVSHEIVRHRPASYCQESTRYCNYGKDGFGGQITVIEPCYLQHSTKAYAAWASSCSIAERAYFDMLTDDCTPQEARAVLPTSLKTELVMTATMGEWMHFLKLRTAKAAHPQMQEVARMVQRELGIGDEQLSEVNGE